METVDVVLSETGIYLLTSIFNKETIVFSGKTYSTYSSAGKENWLTISTKNDGIREASNKHLPSGIHVYYNIESEDGLIGKFQTNHPNISLQRQGGRVG